MKIDDILNLENNRTSDTLGIIYLIKDNGNSPWYKAYEFSAYMLEFFNKDLKQENRLKPTHKEYTKYTLVNVGLQFKSLQKFLPNIFLLEEASQNNILQIEININEINNEININNYKDFVSSWKSTITISKEKQVEQQKTIYSQPVTFMSIMKSILKFNTYNKTHEETIQFINEIKSQCADLIC